MGTLSGGMGGWVGLLFLQLLREFSLIYAPEESQGLLDEEKVPRSGGGRC